MNHPTGVAQAGPETVSMTNGVSGSKAELYRCLSKMEGDLDRTG